MLHRSIFALSVLVLLTTQLLALPAVAEVFRTGPPEFSDGATGSSLRTREAFIEMQRWGAPGPKPIEVTGFLDPEPEGTTYAFVFFPAHSIAFAVVPDQDEPRVVLDANADGDLTNDPDVPLEKVETPTGHSYWSFLVMESTAPNAMRVKVGFSPDRERLLLFDSHRRRGTLRLGDQEVGFLVEGRRGHYGRPYGGLYVDFDGDGEFTFNDLGARGAYRADDEYLWYEGQRYRFEIAPEGESLTLTESSTVDSPPVAVHVGAPATDFSFVDINGREGALSDYLGSTVLIYFWNTSCGPCIQSMPDLAKTYQEYRDRGFRVLGIAGRSLPASVGSLMDEQGLDWRNVTEGETEPIGALYRFNGIPFYVLVDAGGTIVQRGRFDLRATLDAVIPGETALD